MMNDATAITTEDLLRIIGEQHVQIAMLQRMLAQREVSSATAERPVSNGEAGRAYDQVSLFEKH